MKPVVRYKQTINISVSPDTKERLKEYANMKHTTISQAITDWIWRQPLKSENATGMEKKNED